MAMLGEHVYPLAWLEGKGKGKDKGKKGKGKGKAGCSLSADIVVLREDHGSLDKSLCEKKHPVCVGFSSYSPHFNECFDCVQWRGVHVKLRVGQGKGKGKK